MFLKDRVAGTPSSHKFGGNGSSNGNNGNSSGSEHKSGADANSASVSAEGTVNLDPDASLIISVHCVVSSDVEPTIVERH